MAPRSDVGYWRFRSLGVSSSLHFTSPHPQDGGSKVLRNSGIPRRYTTSQPRRRWLESSSPWERRLATGVFYGGVQTALK